MSSDSTDPLYWLCAILSSNHRMELGINLIATLGVIMQLLVGVNLIDLVGLKSVSSLHLDFLWIHSADEECLFHLPGIPSCLDPCSIIYYFVILSTNDISYPSANPQILAQVSVYSSSSNSSPQYSSSSSSANSSKRLCPQIWNHPVHCYQHL